MQVREGEIIAGKYVIERVLGEGGMGFVVQAMHLQLDERVAIKFLLPQALSNEEAVARFAREARAAVKIKSEHVARVSDVGTLETGAPYMVMEFLQGEDLAELVRRQGPLPTEDAADYLLQASEAIAEAHALGIVHRDLKPANLFLIRRADGSPCVKVLDFGISKMTSPGSSGSDLGMTRTHAIMGSPLYMSPEQMASTRDVDARADIWALGAILYELVTGRVPFQADTMPQLCGMILQEPVPPPRSVRFDLSEGLQTVILRCLEKDRTKRFQNVAELAHALVPFALPSSLRSAERISRVLGGAGLASRAAPAQAGSLQPTVAAAGSGATQGSFGKTLSKGGGRALWLLAAAALLVAGAGLAVWLRPRTPPPAAAAAPSVSSSSLPIPVVNSPPTPVVNSNELALSASAAVAPPEVSPPSASASSASVAPASRAPLPAKPSASPRRAGAARSPTPNAAAVSDTASKASEPAAAIDPLRGRH